MNKKFKSPEHFFRLYLQRTPIALAFWRAFECHRFSREKLQHPVLDIGCGDGFFIQVAFEEKFEAGIDLDESEVEQAAKSGSYEKTLRASATSLPFPSRSFKTVISNCVLEHVPDIDMALSEIHRVLKPRGRLMITVPSERFNRTAIRNFLDGIGFPKAGQWYVDGLNKIFKHYHVDDAATWEKRLKKSGLKMEKVDYIVPLKSFYTYEGWMLLAFPAKISKTIFGKWVWGPRGLLKWFATRWLKEALNPIAGPGACYFIAARKR